MAVEQTLPKKDLRIDIERSPIGGNLVRVTHMPSGLTEVEDGVYGSVIKVSRQLTQKLFKRLKDE